MVLLSLFSCFLILFDPTESEEISNQSTPEIRLNFGLQLVYVFLVSEMKCRNTSFTNDILNGEAEKYQRGISWGVYARW